MTDRELRRLSRRDLIELLFRAKKEEASLQEQVAELQHQLADRKIKIDQAGTLAEAVISVNNVLEAAQKAADQYLDEVKNVHSDTDKNCSKMLAEAEETCARREAEADRQINAKWKAFEQKVERYMQTHTELEKLMGSEMPPER